MCLESLFPLFFAKLPFVSTSFVEHPFVQKKHYEVYNNHFLQPQSLQQLKHTTFL